MNTSQVGLGIGLAVSLEVAVSLAQNGGLL
jgi:hypothetical protein